MYQKVCKNGFRFLEPLPNAKQACGPQMRSAWWTPKRPWVWHHGFFFPHPPGDLLLHHIRWQEVLGRQATQRQVPAPPEALHPFFRAGAFCRPPRGGAFALPEPVVDGEGTPFFPYELRWRRNPLGRVLLAHPRHQPGVLHQPLRFCQCRRRHISGPVKPLSKHGDRGLQEAIFDLMCAGVDVSFHTSRKPA